MTTNLLDFDLDGLAAFCEQLGEKRFRATQLFRWIHQRGAHDFSQMTDLAKGNAEALVESGKILAAGLQDLGKSYAEDAKTSYETITADFKEMAAIKSPTELFQLQGKIMRRNFDAMVAATSKGTEHGMKLANEAFAPLTARVNLAVEKLSKAA